MCAPACSIHFSKKWLSFSRPRRRRDRPLMAIGTDDVEGEILADHRL